MISNVPIGHQKFLWWVEWWDLHRATRGFHHSRATKNGMQITPMPVWALKSHGKSVWNQHFDSFLRNFDLIPSDYDPFLYYHNRKAEFAMVIIWVEDGLICSNNNDAIFEIINYLSNNFEMRSSEANHFFELSIYSSQQKRKVCLCVSSRLHV